MFTYPNSQRYFLAKRFQVGKYWKECVRFDREGDSRERSIVLFLELVSKLEGLLYWEGEELS
jgi:hypothetical protein